MSKYSLIIKNLIYGIIAIALVLFLLYKASNRGDFVYQDEYIGEITNIGDCDKLFGDAYTVSVRSENGYTQSFELNKDQVTIENSSPSKVYVRVEGYQNEIEDDAKDLKSKILNGNVVFYYKFHLR